eukprot:scaffold1366_cov91-Cylindrotheca_fusiformis.AAC.5
MTAWKDTLHLKETGEITPSIISDGMTFDTAGHGPEKGPQLYPSPLCCFSTRVTSRKPRSNQKDNSLHKFHFSHQEFPSLHIRNMVQSIPITYKANLLERIGIDTNLDFIVLSFCERIQDDPELHDIYEVFQLDHLISLQKDLLMAALEKPATSGCEQKIRARVALNHYQLFEQGLNEYHFDSLAQHLSLALEDCWRLPQDVRDDCEHFFRELRPIFQEHGKEPFCPPQFPSQYSHHKRTQSLLESSDRKINIADRLSKSETYAFYAAVDAKLPKKKRFLTLRAARGILAKN